MTMAFPDGADDRIQRALNDAKRAELAEKFGGMFIEGDFPLPAEVESEFLQRIEEFELRWADHAMTTVREFIGNPPVKPLSELADSELATELEHLMAVLEQNDIELDFGERPDDAEVYRFIVEELLDHEMDDIRVPGMICHFIYEEFHPNPELDARFAAEWFLSHLLSGNEHLATALARSDLRAVDGSPIDLVALREDVAAFRSRVATVLDHTIDARTCTVDDQSGHVVVDVKWTALESGSMNEQRVEGPATVHLRRGSFEEWEVVRVELPRS